LAANFPKGQHILPRFLLEGFSFAGVNGKPTVFVFRREKEPFPLSIVDVAKERYFYARPDEPNTEAAIQQEEDLLAPLLKQLRSESPGADSPHHLEDLAIHLAIRTKHFRAGMADAITELFEFVFGKMSDPSTIAALAANEPEKFIESITAGLPASLADSQQRQQFVTNAITVLRDNPSSVADELAGFVGQLRQALPFDKLMRDGHNEALRSPSDREGWRRKMTNWRWGITIAEAGTFVLGDFGPIGFDNASGGLTTLLTAEELVGLAFPISHSRLLIGFDVQHLPEGPSLNFDDLARATARLSREFFCSFSCTDREIALHKELGLQGGFFSPEFLQSLKDAMQEGFDQAGLTPRT
jgi:hypothetical protein